MNIVEKLSTTLRHNPLLEKADFVWDVIRPIYNQFISLMGKKGLKRVINGTDTILVLPEFRGVSESYEPEVWQHLMSQVKSGDVIADVGAYIGLYTVALAQRIGETGKVFAFEPDAINFKNLLKQVQLNQVENKVNLIEAAVSKEDGIVYFNTGGHCQSSISSSPEITSQSVKCVCLDSIFSDERLDILKIDVEGYEELVLQGATNLLKDVNRSPRIIYIEVHLYVWKDVGTTWDSLL